MRSAVECREIAQRDRIEETVVGNPCGGKPGSPGGKVILLGMWRGGAIPVTALSPHTSIGS